MSAFRRGRRLFSGASVFLIVIAVAHTLGHGPLLIPKGPLTGALRAMAGDREPLGLGMTPSMLDIHLSLVLTMTALLVVLGALNLLVAAGADDALLRRVLWLNVVSVGALVALYAFYRVPPPLVSFALAEVALVAALFTVPRGRTMPSWRESAGKANT